MDLTLARALRLDADDREPGRAEVSNVVAFVGAGGKTAAMARLAHELPPPVIVTATTHLADSQSALADRHLIPREARDLDEITLGAVTLVSGPAGPEGRLEPAGDEILQHLLAYARRYNLALLIEADGSRQRPLKAPAAHEPALPEFANLVVVVAGLGGLSKPLTNQFVHRAEEFSQLSGLNPGAAITTAAVARVLVHPDGGLMRIPAGARRVAVLNQADTDKLQAEARGMVPELLPAFDAVIIASMQNNQVCAVHEPVAGIVLAAGESKRMGRPKQLLEWHGQTFVRTAAETALAAGLSPVIVVTGAEAEGVREAVQDLPVTLAGNPQWRSGQAASIQVGLAACPGNTGAAIFVLADQPQIPADMLTGLLEAHAGSLSPIVAPLVADNRRGNPVLFDRATFGALRALRGDEGGRSILSRFRVEYLPWNDERLLLDVDTEDDYKRLKDAYGA